MNPRQESPSRHHSPQLNRGGRPSHDALRISYGHTPEKRSPSKLTKRGKAARALLVLTTAAGVGVGAVKLVGEASKPYREPTVKEYVANPQAFPGYEKISIPTGDTAWAEAERTEPDRDPREVVDALIVEDNQNFQDGYGHEGFNAGDPLIVKHTPEPKP